MLLSRFAAPLGFAFFILAGVMPARAEDQKLIFGDAQPFSFEKLIARASDMSHEIYISPSVPQAEVTAKINYDEHGKIRLKENLALFNDLENIHPIKFFHLGSFFQKRVVLNVVDGGEAREIQYSPDYFDMPKDSPAHKLKRSAGFAGFRLQENISQPDWAKHDWAAFLGASYFRAIGDNEQYGLSARGLALNVTSNGKLEEFPDFREFWLEKPSDAKQNVVYALLDSPSVAGAYKFVLTRDSMVVIDVELHLFFRKSVEQVGIAPLTSMYWFSETRKPFLADWRPEVHDSDGLALFTGSGERIWRPLNNPDRVMTSSFIDTTPKGFGLLQRDRNFDHYVDGVFYDRRPSLWVEPQSDWGKGSVQLVEIPTNVEVHDNIVAMWVPAEPLKTGKDYTYRYKMNWQGNSPQDPQLAHVVATRLGQGGRYGVDFPNANRKVLVEFEGASLAALSRGIKPEIVATTSRGHIAFSGVEPLRSDPKIIWDEPSQHWRAQFDLEVAGNEPVELRCFLKYGDKVLTETWAYQYHPVKN